MTRRARIAAAALLAAGCRTALAPAGLPAYLIDPRSGLSGPFPPGVASGWEKMEARQFAEALHAFEAAKGPAAAIGSVQALLELGRIPEARDGCAASFAQGVETAPMLAACGETAARAGQWSEAYDLFEAALLRVPGSSGLQERKKATAGNAVRSLVEKARGELRSQAAEARADAERALAIAPDALDALVVAGRAAAASGDRAAGFERLYAAWKRDPSDVPVGEEAGDLARATGRGDAAYEIFSALARRDPKFRARAEESEEDFVISNWPAPERANAVAARLTRAGAIALLWRLLPEIRTAPAPGPAPVASDILARKDQRILSRALQLGLVSVDSSTHRARPDAFLSRAEAVRILLRAGAITSAPGTAACAPRDGIGPVAAAAACGLLPHRRSSSVSGKEFRRAIAFLQQPRSAGRTSK